MAKSRTASVRPAVFDRAILYEALKYVSQVIPNKPVIDVLSCICFEPDGNRVILTATNLEVWISRSINTIDPVETPFLVRGKQLLDLVGRLGTSDVAITVLEKEGEIKVQSGKGTYKVPMLDAKDFPNQSEEAWRESGSLSRESLYPSMELLVNGVAKDGNRPSMSRILAEPNGEIVNFVATNGHLLVHISPEDCELDTPLLIDASVLSAILRTNGDVIYVHTRPGAMRFECGDTTIILRDLDETFPNWRSVWPKEGPINISLQKDELLAALKRLSPLANPVRYMVLMELLNDSVRLSVQDVDKGTEGEDFLHTDYSGEKFYIAFNPDYMSMIVAGMKTETVHFNMSRMDMAAIVTCDNEHQQALLMPVALDAVSEPAPRTEEPAYN